MTSSRATADPGTPAPRPGRILFLDDDPRRAEIFLADFPEAVWVETVAACLERLAEPWDEVHLDHDLGGEHFVAVDRDDCGMAVVRWLCLEARPHLSQTRFYVHSHNLAAASLMTLQMLGAGYQVECRPFGERWWGSQSGPDGVVQPARGGLRGWLVRILRRIARGPDKS